VKNLLPWRMNTDRQARKASHADAQRRRHKMNMSVAQSLNDWQGSHLSPEDVEHYTQEDNTNMLLDIQRDNAQEWLEWREWQDLRELI
jgi:hypothetical protein